MSTLAIALAKIAVLEARLDALEGRSGGGGAPAPSSGGGAGGSSGDTLPEHVLENAWADRAITRDPKQWKGRTQVGRRYSQAPAEWLEMFARNMDFKAQKGREEVPVRLNNKGKPWHEADTFEAKLLRTWAVRAKAKAAAAPAPPPAASPADDDPLAFNFGANVPADDDIGF